MTHKDIPEEFFNMLPLPIVVTEYRHDDLNYPIVFLNQAFIEQIGWELTDIPDKNTWWQTVYPNKDYAKVIERQWELAILAAEETGQGLVYMDVNLTTKDKGEKRYKIYTQINSQLLPGYYIVAFQAL